MTKKSKRELWPLRRGEHVPERFIKAEPRLRDMEHNAMFRLFMYRRHGLGVLADYWPVIAVVVVIVWIGVALNRSGVGVLAFYALLFAMIVMGRRRQARIGRGLTLLEIPQDRLTDLARTACDGPTAAAGIWGSLIYWRPVAANWLGLLVLGAIELSIAVSSMGSTEKGLFLGFVSFWLLYRICSCAAGEARVLPHAMWTARRARRGAQVRDRLGHTVGNWAIKALRLVLFVLIVVVAGYTFFRVFLLMYKMTGIKLVDIIESRLTPVLLAAAGLIIGIARAWYVRSRREKYFDRISEDMTWILHRLAVEDERVVPGSQAEGAGGSD